jgi:cytochrome c-type biogenesis protein CcsB
VQHDGRVMPLDTLAREAVRRVNGKITVHTNDPVMTFLSWLQEPATSYSAPVVREMPRCIPPTDGNGAWSAPAWTGLHEWAALARGPRLTGWPPAALIEQEVKYNRTEPVRLAWILFALAFAHTGLASLRRSKVLDRFAITSLIAGFGSLTWGIATRWQIAGRIPASNMYESLLFLAWGVGLVALLLLPWMRHRLVLLNASGLAALTLALADLLPIDPFIHPVPPVLAGTPWLAIHVPIIMLSYSMFALSVVVAHLQLGITIWAPRRQEAIENASRVLYWYIHVGCFLLTAGIITGSVWAASSWGRYWGWDPKEVWSLVALLAYLAVLHAWRERLLHRFALAAVSILAFQTIVMTYLGVNFILVNGLHSYAMGTSPVARWMFLVATLELAFLFYAVLARKSRMRRELRVS